MPIDYNTLLAVQRNALSPLDDYFTQKLGLAREQLLRRERGAEQAAQNQFLRAQQDRLISGRIKEEQVKREAMADLVKEQIKGYTESWKQKNLQEKVDFLEANGVERAKGQSDSEYAEAGYAKFAKDQGSALEEIYKERNKITYDLGTLPTRTQEMLVSRRLKALHDEIPTALATIEDKGPKAAAEYARTGNLQQAYKVAKMTPEDQANVEAMIRQQVAARETKEDWAKEARDFESQERLGLEARLKAVSTDAGQLLAKTPAARLYANRDASDIAAGYPTYDPAAVQNRALGYSLGPEGQQSVAEARAAGMMAPYPTPPVAVQGPSWTRRLIGEPGMQLLSDAGVPEAARSVAGAVKQFAAPSVIGRAQQAAGGARDWFLRGILNQMNTPQIPPPMYQTPPQITNAPLAAPIYPGPITNAPFAAPIDYIGPPQTNLPPLMQWQYGQ